MARGTTLLELLVVVTIVTILLAITLPGTVALRDRLRVDQVARRVLAAHARARTSAILLSESVELVVAADSLHARRRRTGELLWRMAGPAADGVRLVGPRRVLAFAPTGLGLAVANATLEFVRGEARRVVITTRLGRARLQR